MKALSLLQPWAGLLVRGIKKVETRSWKTKHKGRLYIHASAKYTNEQQQCLDSFWDQGLCSLDKDSLVTGAIIGYVELIGCMSAKDYKSVCDVGIEDSWGDTSVFDWNRESILGNLMLDGTRIAWICKDMVLFKEPILCKGKLSVWDIPEDIQKLINQQVNQNSEDS